jgi:5-methylcytosine-specific restriction protein A
MWKQCKVSGCAGLTKGKYCEQHAHLEEREKQERQAYYNRTARDAEAQRLYESPAWRRLRALHIKRNPLCEKCFAGGRITPAVIVDHRVEIKDGGGRLDTDNLTSLCRACHNQKTAQERAKRTKNGGNGND